jgi:hypothetical protein
MAGFPAYRRVIGKKAIDDAVIALVFESLLV